ncbi:ABC-three component system protein [Sulfitobacter pontiacus]|uniref:ABC-three component system protein n=1 Tax=Sulfitobacter pontiacus TaxID=60137 RepID=UPI000943BBB8|nr:ABC-three component system protein [Sulfitobacter pontiacus]
MNNVYQKGARADGDLIGRDKTTVINHMALPTKGMVERLLTKLQQQVEDNDETREIIDELARYHRKRSVDGVSGLQAKLEAAGKSASYFDAIEKKEMFVKLLERWSLYHTAQQIFVHILAKAELEFNNVVYLEIPHKTEAEINALVIDRIISPIVEECGYEVIEMSHNVVHGMIYWLAEQCFIRWHYSAQSVT